MGPGWIDTHAHLDAGEFDADRDAMVARARDAGVRQIVLPAVAPSNFDTVRALAARHGFVYALGTHPMAVPSLATDDAVERLGEVLDARRADPRMVAVGEIGIDGFDPACTTDDAMVKQRRVLDAQLALARAHALPVVMHVRKAVDLVLAALRRTEVPGGIAHAFNGSLEQAMVFVAMGFRLGFGGAMTFERALHLRRLARELPLGSIVLETDAPDIAPQWLYRTRAQREAGATMRNEPAELPRFAATLAELRGISMLEIAAATSHNACAALPKLAALLLAARAESPGSAA
jgi:TatD DNase family protein